MNLSYKSSNSRFKNEVYVLLCSRILELLSSRVKKVNYKNDFNLNLYLFYAYLNFELNT